MPLKQTVVLATRNKGKIAELAAMLDDYGLEVLGLSAFPEIGEIEETGETFFANSLLKARTVSEKTGLAAVADDSGLEVDALGGAPGVYSARYAGPGASDKDNWKKLLAEMEGVPDRERSARFRCVMTACAPGGESIVAEGAWEGLITREPEGEGGFGYDPVFYDPEAGMTAAGMDRESKNARSHRGRALRGLLAKWPEFWEKASGGGGP
jgi:XTP/dITP diphosphohydrolase